MLKGNIALTVFFVDDSDSTWNTAAMSTFKAQQATATNQLYKDASPYGVSLNVTIRYEKVKINGTFTINDSYPWVESALKAAGYSDPANVIPTLKSKYNADEAAIMFAVNRVGRSFAWQSTMARGIEYTILHTDQADYRHELYHIFGARDLYTPESVMNIAKEHFTDSIMLTGGTLPMDDLNAYLIGWTDTLSLKAKAFLDDTAWITPEYIAEEAAKETFTGYGTRRFGSGTYTGDMVSGFPHGKGKIVWDSGDTYEGDWVNGEGHGYGTMRWANGVTYTGQLYKWRLHGYGTCTFADGTKQTGQWDNDKFIG